MNIFKNAERSVSTYSFNKKDLRKVDIISDAYAGSEALRRIADKERIARESAEVDKFNKHVEDNSRLEKVVNSSLFESRCITRMNQLASIGKTELFKSILFECYYDSLVIDESFLLEHSDEIRAVIDNYVDSNGGFAKLEKAVESSGSVLLKRMKELCETTCTEACSRKLKEMKECNDPNLINFDLSDNEKSVFNYNVKDLSIDQISKLIKAKVISVIQDDKKREQNNAKLIADIEDELVENENVTDAETMKEALSTMVISDSPIEKATLFNALCRSTYRQVLSENVAITSTDKDTSDEFKEKSAAYDVDSTIDDFNDTKTMDDIGDDVDSIEIDMDTIITEAIGQYTLMEMVYTLKLEDYSATDIRKMTESLVNPRK